MQEQENLSLEENQIRQTIERCAKQWSSEERNISYLLKGEFLIVADKFYLHLGNRLSSNARKFIIASIELRDKKTTIVQTKRNGQLIGGIIGAIAFVTAFALFIVSFDSMVEAEVNSSNERYENVSKISV